MDHWERTLPGRIHCIAYEDLVQDPESHARALLAAVALPWEAGCLQSHQNRNPVATASAAQVRRPIYASSVALWRNYESQLAPVRARLLAAGVPCSP
jgi:hypothetical protein